MNTDILWNNFLDKIKDRISPLSYDTWFKDTKLYKIVIKNIEYYIDKLE